MDGFVMVIGSDPHGALLEVAVNADDQIFHAVPARQKFIRRR